MKGIVGKKLGMTQVFDAESGVVTPVTVIEAAPCPVVQVKTADADGYDAVQIAYDEVAERKLTKPELGHLKKNNVKGAYRHLLELRGQSEAVVGENVTVEVFEPGEKIKVSGIAHGKGFAGTIKRHRFHRGPTSHGSHNVRKPGSIGASATPSRVFKGMKMAGRLGGKRVTQSGLVVHEVRPQENLLLIKGRRARSQEQLRRSAGGQSLMAAPKAPLSIPAGKKAKDVTLEETVFAAELKPHVVHETVRAEMNADRRGTRAAKSRGLVSGGRAKPWRQKGTGRARAGTTRAPQWTGGGVAFPPTPARLRREGEPQDAPLGAPRSSLAARSRRHARRARQLDVHRALDAGAPCALLATWGKELPLVVVTSDEENVARVFPQHRPRRRDDSGRARGHRARLGALGAPHRGRARARRGEGRERLEAKAESS